MPGLCLYLLVNLRGLTYLGMTKHLNTRISQHNSAAPSKRKHYTNRNRPWKLAAVWRGFLSRKQLAQAEYMCKHKLRCAPVSSRVNRAILKRLVNIIQTLSVWLKDTPQCLRCVVHLPLCVSQSKFINRMQSSLCTITVPPRPK